MSTSLTYTQTQERNATWCGDKPGTVRPSRYVNLKHTDPDTSLVKVPDLFAALVQEVSAGSCICLHKDTCSRSQTHKIETEKAFMHI